MKSKTVISHLKKSTWTLLEHLLTQSHDTAETTEVSGTTDSGIRLFSKRVFTVSASLPLSAVLSNTLNASGGNPLCRAMLSTVAKCLCRAVLLFSETWSWTGGKKTKTKTNKKHQKTNKTWQTRMKTSESKMNHLKLLWTAPTAIVFCWVHYILTQRENPFKMLRKCYKVQAL